MASRDPVIAATINGAQSENHGMEADGRGDVDAACVFYRDAIMKLSEAIQMGADMNHADVPALRQHEIEIQDRITYLEERKEQAEAAAELLPISHHIKAVQLTMQVQHPAVGNDGASMPAASSSASNGEPDPRKVMLAAAGVGALAGYMTIGIFLGPLALVGGAAAGAYAVQQETAAGRAVKIAGTAAVVTAGRASQLNTQYDLSGNVKRLAANITNAARDVDERHDISGKATELSRHTYSAVKTFDEKHDVSGKVAEASKTALARAQELNAKHRISERAAEGIAKGMNGLNSLVRRWSETGGPTVRQESDNQM